MDNGYICVDPKQERGCMIGISKVGFIKDAAKEHRKRDSTYSNDRTYGSQVRYLPGSKKDANDIFNAQPTIKVLSDHTNKTSTITHVLNDIEKVDLSITDLSITKCEKRLNKSKLKNTQTSVKTAKNDEKENRLIGRRMYKNQSKNTRGPKEVVKEDQFGAKPVKTGKRMNPMRASQIFIGTSDIII